MQNDDMMMYLFQATMILLNRGQKLRTAVWIHSGIDSMSDPFTLEWVIRFQFQMKNIDQWSFDFSL